jgi:hypothetical protein
LNGGIAALVALLPDGTAVATELDPSGEKCAGFWLLTTAGAPTHVLDRSTTLCPESGSSDGDYLVWEEDSGNFSIPDWTIWSYDLHAGNLREIATWSDFVATPVQERSGPIAPQVDHGAIVWSAIIGNPLQSVVLKAPADGSAPAKVIVRNASNARYIYPRVAFADVTNPDSPPTLAVADTNTGERVELGELPPLGNIAFTGEIIAIAGTDGLNLVRVATGTREHVPSQPGALYPRASTSLISWYDNQHSYVYQIETGVVTQLGTRPSANDTGVAGNYVWWLEDSDESKEADASTFEYIVAIAS